jgi:hypothetical protein
MTLLATSLLRRALVIDALVSGATGLLLVIAGGWLAPLLDVPEPLLRYAGIVLLPFAIVVALVARRDAVAHAGVVAIIVVNIAWVAASAWLVLGDRIQPNALGYAFIVMQAIAVAAFAELQFVALRRVAAQHHV